MKTPTLRKYISLIAENVMENKKCVELKGPFSRHLPSSPHSIYRKFDLKITPEFASVMPGWDEHLADDVKNNDGCLGGEHEIEIDVDMGYNHNAIESFIVLSVDGVELSKHDAEIVKNFVGSLTTEEIESIEDYENEHFSHEGFKEDLAEF